MPLRFPHGYTNTTRLLPSGLVEKRYEGPTSVERHRREVACLAQLGAYLPLPQMTSDDDTVPIVTMRNVAGRHAQELIDEGHAAVVMRLTGSTLRALQAVPVDAVAAIEGDGPVLVHGDFGPQNMLIDLAGGGRVAALLDWEFAHVGQHIEDLAWAEWIVRMHHPGDVDSIEDLLVYSGAVASWTDRHDAMVRRCTELLERSREAGSLEAKELWQARLTATEGWSNG